jgi:predicted nuclease of predicted toxin-antitoxin system
MASEIKIEWRDGHTLRKRWTDESELRNWGTKAPTDIVITLVREGQEVIISTADMRTAPGSHLVIFQTGNTQYWLDCGESLPEALAFVERVFTEGADAFQYQEA